MGLEGKSGKDEKEGANGFKRENEKDEREKERVGLEGEKRGKVRDEGEGIKKSDLEGKERTK